MHINLWGNGHSNAVGRSWHAGHREHSSDSAKSLHHQATQDVVAALRKRLVAESGTAQTAGSSTDSPMQTLVATVKTAMTVRASSGADPVPDVLNAVRAALGDARASLAKAGVSEDDAEQAVANVSQQLGAALSAAPPASAAAAAAQAGAVVAPAPVAAGNSTESSLSVTAAASNYVLTYVRKQKASLDILTQEGDRIQIRFRTKEAVTATGTSVSNTTTATSAATTAATADAAQPATAAGATASSTDVAAATPATDSSASTSAAGTSVHAFASGRVEVSVQGQLSADELKAIGELVSKVDALANEFFQGDIQQAFSSAASLGFDSSQIAGFALKLSQQESYRQSGALPAPKPAAAPVAAPAATPPAVAAPAATPVSTVAEDPSPISAPASAMALDTTTPTPVVSTDAASAESATTPAAASPDAGAASLQDTLGGFVRKVLDTLASAGSSGRLEFSMRWKLSLVVAAVEAGAPKASQAIDSGTSLLTRSLKDVAAQASAAQASTAANSTAA